MKLLLFDIDGTLLTTNGAGRPAVESALADLTGQTISTEGISFSGKTDPQILREVLTHNDVDPAWTNGRFSEAVESFRQTMHRMFDADSVDALDGAQALVQHLVDEAEVQLALLTGNLEEMAYLKVGAIGFDRAHFPFGAFGSDDEDRNALPLIALDRASGHAGRSFACHDALIIGDTPRDIECGRAAGCTTVAVATGKFDRDTLAEHAPDVLLDDLADIDAALRAILG